MRSNENRARFRVFKSGAFFFFRPAVPLGSQLHTATTIKHSTLTVDPKQFLKWKRILEQGRVSRVITIMMQQYIT